MARSPILRDPSNNPPAASEARQGNVPIADRRPPKRRWHVCSRPRPLRMALDPSSGAIAHWKHDPLHDVVEPMADHVVMIYHCRHAAAGAAHRKISCDWNGAYRGCDVIPAGSSARWDIPGPVNVVQLYLPHTTLERVAGEADTGCTGRSSGANGASRPLTSRLLMSAADVLEGNVALDALFRQQLTDLLATRLLAAHAGSPTTFQPAMGGLSPKALLRAIERSALGQRCGRLPCGAGFGCRPVALPLLPRLQGKHRAFASCLAAPAPARAGHEHAARHRSSVVSVAAALGYASQTAFAAAFRKLTGETPSDWRGACVNSNRSTGTVNRSGARSGSPVQELLVGSGYASRTHARRANNVSAVRA